MGTDSPTVSDFMQALTDNKNNVATIWENSNKGQRRQLLTRQPWGFSGDDLDALLDMDADTIKQILKRQHPGAEIHLYRFIK
jgi:hypothetical protein